MENETELKKFRVLIVEPEKPPYVAEIENHLRSLQEMVGGNIQYVGLDRDTFFYCNEEGKLLEMEGNRSLGNDILVGNFFIAGYNDEGELISLTEEQVEEYTQEFLTPESFTKEQIEEATGFISISF